MKKPVLSAAAILALMFQVPAFAGAPELVGTWILEKSENPMPDGSVVSYCTGVHGSITYTDEGRVSVSLNCAPEGKGSEPADISGRRFFYSGPYKYDGKFVTHTMQNASQAELIGQSFSREVTIDGDLLVLTGDNQGQKFSAYWRRLGGGSAAQLKKFVLSRISEVEARMSDGDVTFEAQLKTIQCIGTEGLNYGPVVGTCIVAAIGRNFEIQSVFAVNVNDDKRALSISVKELSAQVD